MDDGRLPDLNSKVTYDRHVTRSATCDSIEEAFAFCLTTIDDERLTVPVINIAPYAEYENGDDYTIKFEVDVSGQTPT